MEPAKQMKIMQEFQRQSAQMDMTVRLRPSLRYMTILLMKHATHISSYVVVEFSILAILA